MFIRWIGESRIRSKFVQNTDLPFFLICLFSSSAFRLCKYIRVTHMRTCQSHKSFCTKDWLDIVHILRYFHLHFFLTHTHITHLNWKLKNADLIWELKNQIATGFFPTLRFLQLSQLARWRHTCHRRNARFPIPPSRLSVLRHLHQLNRPRENWEAEPVGSDLEMVVFGLGDVCWFWRGLGYGIEWWVKVQSIVCWNGSKYWSSFTSLAFEMLR